MIRHCKNVALLLIRFPPSRTPLFQPYHGQTLAGHLRSCSNLLHLHSVQALLVKTSAIQDCYLANQFINRCCSMNQLDCALLTFNQLKFPNVFVYNALIRGIVQCSTCPAMALEFYLEMLRAGVLSTSYTFSSLIKACRILSAVVFGQAVHSHIWKTGFQVHVFVQTSLVEFYGNVGKLVESRRVFDEMPERDMFAWTSMVSVHARSGYIDAARSLFDQMSERNTTSWNAMIDGYARLGDIESAVYLFDQLPTKDLISWTTMVACYFRNKKYKEALMMFNQMTSNGVIPDEVTLATAIASCAHVGALGLGKQLHLSIMQQGLGHDVYIGSALIDMYAKCGNLDRSLVVFLKLKEKNLFSWNSVIEGLAVHGYVKDTLSMFKLMLNEHISPNGVTFISILSACAHAGLVVEGRALFQSMINDFSISPGIEHYGCMVDLLCRADLLADALEVIRSMKFEPNSVIWGALLNGSKRCKNLEIAEFAVSKLMVLEPDNCGYYSLLIIAYAEANRWNDVGRIRLKMKELGIEKATPGCSWIEIGSELHQFSASDSFHLASEEIYWLIDELDGQVKLHSQLLEPRHALLDIFS